MTPDLLDHARTLAGTDVTVTLIDGNVHQGRLARVDEDALTLAEPVTMPATARLLLVTQIIEDVIPA